MRGFSCKAQRLTGTRWHSSQLNQSSWLQRGNNKQSGRARRQRTARRRTLVPPGRRAAEEGPCKEVAEGGDEEDKVSSSPQIVLFRSGSASVFPGRYETGGGGGEGEPNLRRRHCRCAGCVMVCDASRGTSKDAKGRCRNVFLSHREPLPAHASGVTYACVLFRAGRDRPTALSTRGPCLLQQSSSASHTTIHVKVQ